MSLQQRLAQFFARGSNANATAAPASIRSREVPAIVAVMVQHQGMGRATAVLGGSVLCGASRDALNLDSRLRDVSYLFGLMPTTGIAANAPVAENGTEQSNLEPAHGAGSDPISQLMVGSSRLSTVAVQTPEQYDSLFFTLLSRNQSRWGSMYASLGENLGGRGDLVGAMLANEGAQVAANAERLLQNAQREGINWYLVPVKAEATIGGWAAKQHGMPAESQAAGAQASPEDIVAGLEAVAAKVQFPNLAITGEATLVPQLPLAALGMGGATRALAQDQANLVAPAEQAATANEIVPVDATANETTANTSASGAAIAMVPTAAIDADEFVSTFEGNLRVLAADAASANFVAQQLIRFSREGVQGMTPMEDVRLVNAVAQYTEQTDADDPDDWQDRLRDL